MTRSASHSLENRPSIREVYTMADTRYLCLRCGVHFAAPGGGENGRTRECPICRGDNVVKENPSRLLELLIAGSSGGGG